MLSGYDKVTISVLRESQIDMPMEEVEDCVPSPPPMEVAQPPKAGIRARIQDIFATR